MKTPLLGLVAATTAFAGSSIYLWVQLDAERDRAAQVAETARKLNARIAELEQARAVFDQRRMAGGAVVGGTFGSFSTSAPMTARLTPAPPPDGGKVEPAQEGATWSAVSRPPSPAFSKMMRNQMRTSIRRQYSGIGAELGLDKETSAKLVDLLTEQQTANFDAAGPRDLIGPQYDYQHKHQEYEAEIANLIGPDKAQELKAYQASLPARSEADMLARQLEDNGVPLSAAQVKDLTKVVIEEHDRVPMPQFIEGMDQKEYMKSVNDWKTDYDKRIADEAAHIFNAEQLATYNDIQQWQKDLRDQFAAAGMPGIPSGRMRVGVASGNAVSYSAAPVTLEATVVGEMPESGQNTPGAKPKKP